MWAVGVGLLVTITIMRTGVRHELMGMKEVTGCDNWSDYGIYRTTSGLQLLTRGGSIRRPLHQEFLKYLPENVNDIYVRVVSADILPTLFNTSHIYVYYLCIKSPTVSSLLSKHYIS